MKTAVQNYINDKIKFLPFFCFTLLLIGCRIDKQDANPKPDSVLEISVGGIEALIESNPNKLSSISAPDKKTENIEPEHSIQLTKTDNFDVLTTFTKNIETAPGNKGLQASKSIGKPSLQAAAPPEKLVSGRKYRVVLYRVQGGTETHWRTLNLTSGTQVNQIDTVGVVKGHTYRYIAYSYNDTDNLPAYNVSNPVVSMGVNKDFLYTSNTITIAQSGNTKIDITFQRKTARVAVEVDARGLFTDKINSMTITFPANIIKTANFNLGTGQIVAGSTVELGAVPISGSFGPEYNVDGANEYSKRIYLHTVAPLATGPININMTALSINTEDNTARVYTFPVGGTNIPVANFGLTIGYNSRAKVDLIESAITYAGADWARSNLYRSSPTGNNRYRFYNTNRQTSADTRGFFSFKGHIPMRLAYKNNWIDPCQLVYPYDRWRLPLPADIVGVTSAQGILTNVLSLTLAQLLGLGTTPNTTVNVGPNTDTDNYIEYTNSNGGTATYFPAANKKLRFYHNGIHVVSNVLTVGQLTLVSLNLGSTKGVSNGFWSSHSAVGLFGLAQLGSYSYYGRTVVPLVGSPSGLAMRTSSLLGEIGLLGIDVLSSNFQSVRCVRNAAWNPNAPGYNPQPNYRDAEFL